VAEALPAVVRVRARPVREPVVDALVDAVLGLCPGRFLGVLAFAPRAGPLAAASVLAAATVPSGVRTPEAEAFPPVASLPAEAPDVLSACRCPLAGAFLSEAFPSEVWTPEGRAEKQHSAAARLAGQRQPRVAYWAVHAGLFPCRPHEQERRARANPGDLAGPYSPEEGGPGFETGPAAVGRRELEPEQARCAPQPAGLTHWPGDVPRGMRYPHARRARFLSAARWREHRRPASKQAEQPVPLAPLASRGVLGQRIPAGQP